MSRIQTGKKMRTSICVMTYIEDNVLAFAPVDNYAVYTVTVTVSQDGEVVEQNTIDVTVANYDVFSYDGASTLTLDSSFEDPESITIIIAPDTVDGVAITDVELPVENLGNDAYNSMFVLYYTNVTSFTYGRNVNCKIDDNAFADSSCKEVLVRGSITEIEFWAFVCSSIESFVVLGSLNKLNAEAFLSCYNLTELSIPDGVTMVASSSHGVDLNQQLLDCNVYDEYGGFYSSTGKTLYCVDPTVTSFEIPNTVTTIASYAFFRYGIYKQNEISATVEEGSALTTCIPLVRFHRSGIAGWRHCHCGLCI